MTAAIKNLKDVADIVMGQSPTGETCNRDGTGLPLLNGPTEFGPMHPYPTQFTTDARKKSNIGDLLFCVRGSTTGRMNWADQEYAIGRGIAAIRHRENPKLQPLVRAAIEVHLSVLLQSATGSTFPNVSGPQLGSVPFPAVSMIEAESMAATLGALDDKINLNRRMNETLEAMARALFKNWFVDFGPTRAKMEGREPYLAQEIWDLFPDKLDDDGKPEGWEERPLRDVAVRITKGTTPGKADFIAAEGEKPEVNFVKVNAISDDGAILRDRLENLPASIHTGTLKRSILEESDVLYTIAGTIGRVAIVDLDLLPANTNQAVAIIRAASERVPPGYLRLLMTLPEFREELHANVVHAVQANLSLGMISDAKAIFPPKDTIFRLFELIDLLLKRIRQNRTESRTLSQTRDLLLPKLMSGEIRITAAQQAVQEAI